MDNITPDPIQMLKAASELIHELTDQVDSLQNELAVAKAANLNKVELEKVASPKLITAEKAAQFADYLASRAIIADNDREKYASACMEDPNNLVDIAQHALKLSELPASQGYGIKTANADNTPEAASLKKERSLWSSIC